MHNLYYNNLEEMHNWKELEVKCDFKRKAYGQLLEWKEKYADKYNEEKKGNTMNITILEKKDQRVNKNKRGVK